MTKGDALNNIMKLPNVKEVLLKQGEGFIYMLVLYKTAKGVIHQKQAYFPADEDSELTAMAYWDVALAVRSEQKCAG